MDSHQSDADRQCDVESLASTSSQAANNCNHSGLPTRDSFTHTSEKLDSFNHTGEKLDLAKRTGEKLDSSNHTGAIIINDLPDELLLRIFSYFPPHQLCILMALVCSKWHSLARTPTVWKRLDIEISRNLAVKLFKSAHLQQLKSLVLRLFPGGGSAILTLVSTHCPSLTSLTCYGASDVTREALRTLAAGCANICDLEITEFGAAISAIGNTFGLFCRLRVLRIGVRFSSAFAAHFDISGCSRLQQVHLSLLGGSDLEHSLPQFLGRMQSSLASFELNADNVRLTDDCCQVLARCSKLAKVVIYSQMSDDNLKTFAKLNALTHFECIFDQLSTAGLTTAFKMEGSFPVLKDLRLQYVDALTDDVLIAVAEKCASTLTLLALMCCSAVTDKGICRVVTKCSKLETLQLIGMKLSGFFMWPMPNYVPRFRSLFVCSSDIDVTFARELKQARPGINVIVNNEYV